MQPSVSSAPPGQWTRGDFIAQGFGKPCSSGPVRVGVETGNLLIGAALWVDMVARVIAVLVRGRLRVVRRG